MHSTIDATMEHLVVNGLCYRYTEAPVGVAGKESTFTLCTFWLVSALIMAGRVEEAVRYTITSLAKASPLGLFAEELDPETGRAYRKLPQAFSHLGVIHAAVTFAWFGGVGKLEMGDWVAANLAHIQEKGSPEAVEEGKPMMVNTMAQKVGPLPDELILILTWVNVRLGYLSKAPHMGDGRIRTINEKNG